MKKIILTCLSILYFQYAFCQMFTWQTSVDKISKNGFYKIFLNPEISSHLKSDFSDIRIYDSNKDEIPYLLQTEVPQQKSFEFKEYKIIEKKHFREKGYTRLVIQNQNKTQITNILLIIKNSEVKKWLKLNGSDDGREWFVLKDNYFFESFPSNFGTSEIRVLNFPLVNYEYLELMINDYFDEPINILKAGYMDLSVEKGKYTEINQPVISQIENTEKKESLVKIEYKQPYYLDKISFAIEYETFFLRKAELCIKDSIKVKNMKTEIVYTPFYSIELNSNSENIAILNKFYTKEFYLKIYNNDNKPLKIKSVLTYQLNSYLTANLKKDNQYFLRFGCSDLKAPVYDINYFQDSIPKKLDVIKTSNLQSIKSDSISDKSDKKDTMMLIWIAIIAVVALLGFMTIKMMGEMKKKS